LPPLQAHAAPAAVDGNGSTATGAALLAELGRATRQEQRIQQPEKRLSELMGEQAWREPGLGAQTDVDQLQSQVTDLEQQVVGLRERLDERDQELDAARAAKRQLIADLNRNGWSPGTAGRADRSPITPSSPTPSPSWTTSAGRRRPCPRR
jgi:polyhydroxyalkanoate synthesis regulator phasin